MPGEVRVFGSNNLDEARVWATSSRLGLFDCEWTLASATFAGRAPVAAQWVPCYGATTSLRMRV